MNIQCLFPALAASHRHSIVAQDGAMLTLEGVCPVTKKTWSLAVAEKGYSAWISGALIQHAFPELSKEERELLLSGTSEEGWEQLFRESEPD